MSFYGAFSSSVLGMRAQSEALTNIGINVANVNTGGYKRVDTHFKTLLANSEFNERDLGGLDTKTYNRFDSQGTITASNSGMDVAISGKGYLALADAVNDGNVYYGRDGSFQMVTTGTETITDTDGVQRTVSIGYLADKNGYFAQGWAADTEGNIDSTGDPESLRIDRFGFVDAAAQTTTATLRLNLPSGADIGDNYTYHANLVDTGGENQALQMKWTNTAQNKWDLVTTHDSTPIPQIDTLTLSGTPETGDIYSVTIGSTTVSYTLDGTESTLEDVATGLAAAVNASATLSALVTAAGVAGTNTMTLTSVTAGSSGSFTATPSATNGAVAAAQVDTVTLGGTVETGDQYTVDVNGNAVTYTVLAGDTTLNDVRTGLINAINANGAASALVTAAAGATDGTLTLTSTTAGSPFTTTPSTPVTGATVDNTATVATTTANAVSTADNAMSGSTTQTAGNTQVVSTATAFTFDGDGLVQTPTSYNFTGTWSNGETTTMSFDMTGLTQYSSGDMFVYSYDNNGHAAGRLGGIEFDNMGRVLGLFDNGRTRPLYQLALADFVNPNAMDKMDGNVFAITEQSGGATYKTASVGGANFVSYATELSNVDLANEFSKIIMTQNAYNSSATVFKTVDEMAQVAGDMKG